MHLLMLKIDRKNGFLCQIRSIFTLNLMFEICIFVCYAKNKKAINTVTLCKCLSVSKSVCPGRKNN